MMDKEYQRMEGCRDVQQRNVASQFSTAQLPAVLAPITGGIQRVSVTEACHRLFIEAAGFYLGYYDRLPPDVVGTLNALYRAYKGNAAQVSILKLAIVFFEESVADRNMEVHDAISAARLALVMSNDTSAKIRAIKIEEAKKGHWML